MPCVLWGYWFQGVAGWLTVQGLVTCFFAGCLIETRSRFSGCRGSYFLRTCSTTTRSSMTKFRSSTDSYRTLIDLHVEFWTKPYHTTNFPLVVTTPRCGIILWPATPRNDNQGPRNVYRVPVGYKSTYFCYSKTLVRIKLAIMFDMVPTGTQFRV